jgi:hypothetical protein
MTSLPAFLLAHKPAAGGAYTHTRIGDKTLGVFGGVYTIPDEDYAEFWQLYSHHLQSGKQEYLTERQYPDGPLVVDLDFHYAPEIEDRQHTEEDIENIVALYAEHLADMVSGKMPTYDIYVSHKSAVNMLDEKTKDGIHIFFSVRVPRIIQKALRTEMLDLLPQILEHLPLINSWDGVLDEGITNGVTNWQLLGSRKPANKAYEITHGFRVLGAEISPIDVGSIDKSKISVRCKEFPMVSANTSNETIMTLLSRKTTPSASPKPRLGLATTTTDASAFIASIPAEKAGPFQTWASYCCMLIRKYRETKNDAEMRDIIHEFSRKAADCYDEAKVDDWIDKYEDAKFPEDMRFPEASAITDEVREASRQVLAAEVFPPTPPITEYGVTDEDFSVIAYRRLKNDYVYSQGQLFHKEGNIWSNDTKSFQSSLRTAIIALKMIKRTFVELKGKTITTEVFYCDILKNVRSVATLTEDKIICNPDPEFYQKLHTTTLGKLCFDDGVYDFRRRAFYEWNSHELKSNPVYSLTKIHRNFPKSVDDAFKRECYDRVFVASMGEENAARWVAFLSRAVAGEITDKLFATIITNRDCSKGVTNDWLMSAFGSYVRQAESTNFLVQRERSGADAAKENGWLVDFQTVRLMLVQEFPIDMKNKGMKINSKLIKSINSGGDQIEGRKNYKDAMTFNIQSSTVFMVNDLPAYTTDDVLEKCVQLTSTVQFKQQEFIDDKLEEAEGNEELYEYRKNRFKVADPNLRTDVKSHRWADALVRLLIDNYADKHVTIQKSAIEGEQDIQLDERILSAFKLSGCDDDFVSNEDMRDLAVEWGCSLKKLKIEILGMNSKIREGIHKEGSKKFKGFRGIALKE